MPKVLIFAGANGTGKTTLANNTIISSMPFINADDIKKKYKLSDIDAGKKALLEIDSCISKHINFSFETTMSGLGLLKRFKHLEKEKYNVIVFYLFAYPVELLSERIKERIRKGGHKVLESDIIRRYYRSVNHFWKKYKIFADEWIIIHNNEFQYKNIAVGKKNAFSIVDDLEYKRFMDVLKHEEEEKNI